MASSANPNHNAAEMARINSFSGMEYSLIKKIHFEFPAYVPSLSEVEFGFFCREFRQWQAIPIPLCIFDFIRVISCSFTKMSLF